jgi:hypothetical protein
VLNGRRQPSRDGTSRMTRERQVRFCERLGVKLPGPTRQQRSSNDVCVTSAITPTAARALGRSVLHKQIIKKPQLPHRAPLKRKPLDVMRIARHVDHGLVSAASLRQNAIR